MHLGPGTPAYHSPHHSQVLQLGTERAQSVGVCRRSRPATDEARLGAASTATARKASDKARIVEDRPMYVAF